jgi:deoxycytidylate deaminase
MTKFKKYLRIINEIANLNTDKIQNNKEISNGFLIAQEAAKKSTCGRKHVGAAIFYWSDDVNKYNLKNGDLVSKGWNGYKQFSDEKRYGKEVPMPTISCKDEYKLFAQRGIDKDSDEGRALHLIIMKNEIHAEDRAIQAAISKYDEEILKKCCIFTTLSPCKDCAAEIKKYGIAVGGWLEKYNRDKGEGIKSINKILLNNKITQF